MGISNTGFISDGFSDCVPIVSNPEVTDPFSQLMTDRQATYRDMLNE
jgi:hypothetical protein